MLPFFFFCARFRDTIANYYCNTARETPAISFSQIASFRSDEQTIRVKAFSCTKYMNFTGRTRYGKLNVNRGTIIQSYNLLQRRERLKLRYLNYMMMQLTCTDR